MNIDELEGKWDQIKGKVKERWGKFTNDDISVMHGKTDQLIGKLRERYGYSSEKATREVGAFVKDCGCASEGKPKSAGCDRP
jgi:uncharacterized protein YjbJ (UPF0337 family)